MAYEGEALGFGDRRFPIILLSKDNRKVQLNLSAEFSLPPSRS